MKYFRDFFTKLIKFKVKLQLLKGCYNIKTTKNSNIKTRVCWYLYIDSAGSI